MAATDSTALTQRLIGYARVSTSDQETHLQLDALAHAGCTTVFQEKASGASQKGRPELANCIRSLEKGDVLLVYKIDRIARSLTDLLDILRQLEQVGATIRSLTEPIDTTNSMGMFVVQILGAVAQLERAIIRERSMAGQIAARNRGSMPGRSRALATDTEAAMVEEYQAGKTTYRELAEKHQVSVSVVKRAMYRATKPATYRTKNKV